MLHHLKYCADTPDLIAREPSKLKQCKAQLRNSLNKTFLAPEAAASAEGPPLGCLPSERKARLWDPRSEFTH